MVAPIDGRLTRVVDVPLGAACRVVRSSRGYFLRLAPGDLPQLQRARAGADRGRAGHARPRARRTLDERWCCAREAARRGSFGRGTGQGPFCRGEASLAQYNAAQPAAPRTQRTFLVRAPVTA